MKHSIFLLFVINFVVLTSCGKEEEVIPFEKIAYIEKTDSVFNSDSIAKEKQIEIKIKSICQKPDKYLAFCDIIHFHNKLYCVFRESNSHQPTKTIHPNGYLQIMSSKDNGENWVQELTITDDEWDLRDPCFCKNTNEDILNLYYGRYSVKDQSPAYKNGVYQLIDKNNSLEIYNHSSVNNDPYSKFWIWKVLLHNNKYYGIAYFKSNYPLLVESTDGVNFRVISEIEAPGSEAGFCFLNDRLYVFFRNDEKKKTSLLAYSDFPYTIWNWKELGVVLESPECVIVNNDIYVMGRADNGFSVYKFNKGQENIDLIYNYPTKSSWYDYGYPGAIFYQGMLYALFYMTNGQSTLPDIYMLTIPQEGL